MAKCLIGITQEPTTMRKRQLGAQHNNSGKYGQRLHRQLRQQWIRTPEDPTCRTCRMPIIIHLLDNSMISSKVLQLSY